MSMRGRSLTIAREREGPGDDDHRLDEEMAPQLEDEEDLDQRVSKVQGLFKFKSFYNQMDFDSKQRVAITKAIMKLANSREGVNLVEKRTGKNNRFEDEVLVFYENNHRDAPTQHNRPLLCHS